jgi:TRAP-type C4-dicarboxylate transport system permease small subunit
MIGLVAVNVLLRYCLSFGSVWAQELEWHLLAPLILLGMSYAMQRGDNVRVDVFYANFSAAQEVRRQPAVGGADAGIALLFIKLSLATWRRPTPSARPRPTRAASRSAGP